MVKTVAEIIGGFAVAGAFVMFQQTERKRLIFCKLIIDLLWIIHLAMLGGYTGLCITVIAVFRELVFMNRDKPFFSSNLWLYLFILLYALTPIFTWQGIFSIFPAISASLASVSFWMKSVKKTKCISILVSCSQLVYVISINSYSAIVNEAVTLTSIIISLIRTRGKNGK